MTFWKVLEKETEIIKIDSGETVDESELTVVRCKVSEVCRRSG